MDSFVPRRNQLWLLIGREIAAFKFLVVDPVFSGESLTFWTNLSSHLNDKTFRDLLHSLATLKLSCKDISLSLLVKLEMRGTTLA